MGNHIPKMPYMGTLIEIFHLKTVNEFNEFLLDTCRTMCTNVMDHPCKLNTSKQIIHIISFEPITSKASANSFHEFSMTSVSIDVIGEFWRAMKRELIDIV